MGEVLRKNGPGGTPAQDCPGIVVHPLFGLSHLRRRYAVKVGAFRKETADDPVHVLIAAPLIGAVRMAEKHQANSGRSSSSEAWETVCR